MVLQVQQLFQQSKFVRELGEVCWRWGICVVGLRLVGIFYQVTGKIECCPRDSVQRVCGVGSESVDFVVEY